MRQVESDHGILKTTVGKIFIENLGMMSKTVQCQVNVQKPLLNLSKHFQTKINNENRFGELIIFNFSNERQQIC